MQKIPLILVTSRAEDVAELNELFHDTPWELAQATELKDACAVLKAASVPILLFDRDAPGPDWKTAIKRLIQARKNACVILISGVADQYLWEEVIHNGGFDLLTRPFRREQLLSALIFAYAHCRTPWPKKAVS